MSASGIAAFRKFFAVALMFREGGFAAPQIRRSVIQSSPSSAAELAKETSEWGSRPQKDVSQNILKAFAKKATTVKKKKVGEQRDWRRRKGPKHKQNIDPGKQIAHLVENARKKG